MHYFTILMFFAAFIFLVSGILYKFFPPKEKTWFYGMNLKSALKTKETWIAAHQYSSKLSLLSGVTLTAIALIPTLINNNTYFSIITAASIIATVAAVQTLLINRHLNNNFNENGERKEVK